MDKPSNIPRGIELVIAKAAADPEFRRRLFGNPVEAAREIGVELTPEEVAILKATPAGQLDAVVGQTKLSRGAFIALAGAGAAVVAAAALPMFATATGGSRGIRPDSFYCVEENDFRGDTFCCQVLKGRELRARSEVLDRANAAMGQALEQARDAWSRDPGNHGQPFPVGSPRTMFLFERRGFARREQAEAAVQERLREIEELAAISGGDDACLANMNDEDRARELRTRAAWRLFEEKLRALVPEAFAIPAGSAPKAR